MKNILEDFQLDQQSAVSRELEHHKALCAARGEFEHLQVVLMSTVAVVMEQNLDRFLLSLHFSGSRSLVLCPKGLCS